MTRRLHVPSHGASPFDWACSASVLRKNTCDVRTTCTTCTRLPHAEPVRIDSPTARVHTVAACTLPHRPCTASMHPCGGSALWKPRRRLGPGMVCVQYAHSPDTGQRVYGQREPATAAAAGSRLVETVTLRPESSNKLHTGCAIVGSGAASRFLAGARRESSPILPPNQVPPVLRALRSHTGVNGQIPVFSRRLGRRASPVREILVPHRVHACHSAGEVRAWSNCEPSIPSSSIQGLPTSHLRTSGPPTWRED